MVIRAGDFPSGNDVQAFYHIDDTTGGIRNWRINQSAYNGTTQSRVFCNLASSQNGDVHGEMEAGNDLTIERSNVGLFVNYVSFSHSIQPDSIDIGVRIDTSGLSYWNYGRSGMGIGGYHFPLYHGSSSQVLTDDGTGQLFWGNSGGTVSQHFTQIAYGDSMNHISGDSLFTRDKLGQITMLRNQGTASIGFLSDTAILPFSPLYGVNLTGSGISWFDTIVKTYAGIDVIQDPAFLPYPGLMILAGDSQGNSLHSYYHIDDTSGGIRNWRISQSAYNGASKSRSQCDLASYMNGDVYTELDASCDTSNENATIGISVHQLSLSYGGPTSSTSINSISLTIDSNGFGFSNNTVGSTYYMPKAHGNPGQAITDDGMGNLSFTYSGVISESFDSTLSGSYSVVINLPFALNASTYKVVVTASNSLTAGTNCWLDNKSNSSFQVNFSSAISGEVKFDWILTP